MLHDLGLLISWHCDQPRTLGLQDIRRNILSMAHTHALLTLILRTSKFERLCFSHPTYHFYKILAPSHKPVGSNLVTPIRTRAFPCQVTAQVIPVGPILIWLTSLLQKNSGEETFARSFGSTEGLLSDRYHHSFASSPTKDHSQRFQMCSCL